MSLVDGFGRHYDRGVIEWAVTGAVPHRVVALNCRHGRTGGEDFSDESEGVLVSRLITQHQDRVNSSEQSYKGGWLCYCEPHRPIG